MSVPSPGGSSHRGRRVATWGPGPGAGRERRLPFSEQPGRVHGIGDHRDRSTTVVVSRRERTAPTLRRRSTYGSISHNSWRSPARSSAGSSSRSGIAFSPGSHVHTSHRKGYSSLGCPRPSGSGIAEQRCGASRGNHAYSFSGWSAAQPILGSRTAMSGPIGRSRCPCRRARPVGAAVPPIGGTALSGGATRAPRRPRSRPRASSPSRAKRAVCGARTLASRSGHAFDRARDARGLPRDRDRRVTGRP